jgi:hypothetical protein
LGGLNQGHVEQRRQTATALDFGACPLVVIGTKLGCLELIGLDVELPDLIFLIAGRQVQEENPVEPLRATEFGRQPRDVIGRADHEDVGAVVVEPA